jgi:NAD(P)H-dependent flavin oxidoreductase YrpB (nitropropane dioxygenase family)
MSNQRFPTIIQGGMGIAVSSNQLAKEVAKTGNLGVISGTAIDSVIARRLQDGDLDGSIRRAMKSFPNQDVIAGVLDRYFIEGGRDQSKPYIDVPKITLKPVQHAIDLLVVSSFVEVWLAKEGHDGLIGMNLLEKIQMCIPAQLFGAMLANVDYILIGAGIPAQIPNLLNQLALGNPIAMNVDVAESTIKHFASFDPQCIAGISFPIKRPLFLAIVSSHALVAYLNKDEITKPDGYVIEGHVAGGHNAPPRNRKSKDEEGNPIYTEQDDADLVKIKNLGSPFWLAGGYATPEKVKEAIAAGAEGVQVGSLFALADESGFTPDLKQEVIDALTADDLTVKTDGSASPTGFPFKVAVLPNSLSDDGAYEARNRICDLGYLRTPFERENGGVGYRCPSEPLKTYEFKKGNAELAQHSQCLCNALMSNIGLGQLRPDGRRELPLITLGSDLSGPDYLAKKHPKGWKAQDVIDYLLGK